MRKYRKAYHDEWSSEARRKARHGGIILEDEEAWLYLLTHTDKRGKYDLWYLPDVKPQPMRTDMTLRDHFASEAMVVCASFTRMEDLAEVAYELADAMMAERKKVRGDS